MCSPKQSNAALIFQDKLAGKHAILALVWKCSDSPTPPPSYFVVTLGLRKALQRT